MAFGKRIKIVMELEVDLDGVPGWGNLASDFTSHINRTLQQTIPHYKPVLFVVENGQATVVE